MRSEVIRSAVIDAPIDRVWEVLRDFGNQEQWHPNVTLCQLENDLDGDAVGCVRRYSLDEETELREQLLSHSDLAHTYTCAILDSSLPLFDSLTTLSLKPVTDSGKTFVHWSARFRAPRARAEELNGLIGQRLFTAGLTGLRSFFGLDEKPAPQARREARQAAPLAPGEDLPGLAMVIESPGEPDQLVLLRQSVPAPKAGEVRIRQAAAGVNYLDTLMGRGLAPGLDFPATPGLAGVGEIIDVGPRVNGLFPGDRVAWLGRAGGAYADICLVNGRDCVPLPEKVSDLQGASLLKGMIAGLLMGRVFRAGPGASILIEQAAGGLGHILCQWARALDMLVIGAVNSEEQARFARDLGCGHPIVVGQEGALLDQVMRVTEGRGVDFAALDGRGLKAAEALPCLARFGHLAMLRGEKGLAAGLDWDKTRPGSLTVSLHDCFDYFEDRLYMQRLAQAYFAKLQGNLVKPVLETMPLSSAGQAQQKVLSLQNLGAVCLMPD